MRISLSWLRELIRLDDSPEQIADILSSLGLEVEGIETIESIPGGLKGVIVGEVVECIKHPNADKLSLTKVNIGKDNLLQIVCGAPNVAIGQKVLVATEGTKLYPSTGEAFTIKKGKIRGEDSQGMICAQDELGIGSDHSGIMVLDITTSVGLDAASVLGLESEIVFEIGLTPNRADATNHIGVAKDLAAWYRVHRNMHLEFCNNPTADLNYSQTNNIKVIVNDNKLCPRYSGICLDQIKIGESPDWIKKKLLCMDQKSINNVVDITNIVMYEMGQPLHAFDLDQVEGRGFKVQTLSEGTSFKTLDDLDRKLRADDLMICDLNDNPMCIAGVLGGKHSGVSDNTTSIFLESAHFQASSIRKSSTKHNIRSQAARSFEKGSDPNITVKALQRAVYLMQEYCGAKISSSLIDLYPQEIKPNEIKINVEVVQNLSGLDINKDTLSEVLLALDMEVMDHQNDQFTVYVPTNKPDVTRPADVIEEISRVYGLNQIPLPEKFSYAMLNASSSNYQLKQTISEALVNKGMNEIVSMSLHSSKICMQTKLWDESSLIYIHNTSNSHLDIMKPSILIGGLDAIQYNINRQNTDLHLFEIGKEFYSHEKNIKEKSKLAIWLTGLDSPAHWTQTKDQISNFHSIKTIVESVFQLLKIEKLSVNPINSNAIWSYGSQWSQGNLVLASCGLVKENICKTFDIKKSVWYAEFDLELIFQRKSKTVKKFQEFTKFPVVKRDLALIIDKHTSFDNLQQIATKTCGKMLSEINVFDVFEDEKKLGEGKKSYALNFSFENMDRSMTTEEIDQLMNQLILNFEKNAGALIRK